MTTGHYLRSMRQLTNQWTPTNFRDERRQRLYLKDIDCPPEWHERLRSVLPPNSFYLNENVEQKPARRNDEMDVFPEDHVTAPAGDLMSSLPSEMRAQNLMCYIGHEGTYTAAHKEMCASLGQNIMVDASGDGNGEKPGSSVWIMTETKDREVVREYFLSMLGHDIEIEKHFAQINAWKKGAFPVYIVEQKVGDFVLVPPLAPHQVWNRGTRTMKVAWNRTTVETLEMALHEALPRARLVCRDEQYKNKAIIYYTLKKYHKELADMQETAEMGWLGIGQDLFRDSPRVKQLVKDFKALFSLYTEILVDEMFNQREKDVEYIEFDSNITCSYCRANIFNRFLTCKHCVRQLVDGDEDTYDVCMECYAMGRSCLCISGLNWCEQWKWPELVGNYETWRAMVIRNDGYVDLEVSPVPLEIARRKFGKKPVAQICQEQLRRRPWKDITKNEIPSDPEPSEPEVNAEGRSVKKKRRKKKKGNVHRCHVCAHKDYNYRLAFCSTAGCTEAYCYGVLYRAFDMMPQSIMQDENWKCPKCLDICNCAYCRRNNYGTPYVPKNTLLGHDTRPIADDRSVESLVDFRLHNLAWLKNVGDESRNLQSKRMQRLKQAAEAEKAKDDELVNQLPALRNGDETVAPDAAALHRPTNGYGDQNHGPDSGIMGGYGMAVPVGQGQPELHQPVANAMRPGPMPAADMSLGEDGLSMYPDPSSYPDPSVLGHKRMLGMGFYQQDDSPDKILFDPYQMPSAETMVEEAPEVSEYVKKALRAAKRRARQEEDDDPDFAPNMQNRKRPRADLDPQLDMQDAALDNMDPALFAQESTAMDVAADSNTPAETDSAEATEEGESADPPQGDGRRSVYPHRPALRHSRPTMSYAEFDAGEDEFDEVVPAKTRKAPPPPCITDFNPEDANRDPQPCNETEKPPAAASPAGAKRRGPGLPRKSEIGQPVPEKETPTTTIAMTTTSEPQTSVRRRRGGPRASHVSEEPVEPARAEAEDSGRQSSIDNAIEELEAQLAREIEAFDDNGEQIGPVQQPPPQPELEIEAPAIRRRPGRPRRSGTAETQPELQAKEKPQRRQRPRRGTPQMEPLQLKEKPQDTPQEKSNEKPQQKKPQVTPIPKRQVKTVTVELRSVRTSPPAPDVNFLSMKERMALKGKKFKIGKPKSAAAATSSGEKQDNPVASSTPGANRGREVISNRLDTEPRRRSTRSHTPVSSFAAPSTTGSSDYLSQNTKPRSPAPQQEKKPVGPTIVRLGDSEDEYEDSDFGNINVRDESSSESSSDSGDEYGDIPARKAPQASSASRGGLPAAVRASLRGSRGGRFARRGKH